METVNIIWDGKLHNFEDMFELIESEDRFLDQYGFYHIFAGTYNEKSKKYTHIKKLYIGMAYEQKLRERLTQDHLAYKKIRKYLQNHPDRYVMIRVGCILKSDSDRRTKELYLDIENALIYNSQPAFNVKGKESYNGRNIKIRNIGMNGSLKKVISINNGQ